MMYIELSVRMVYVVEIQTLESDTPLCVCRLIVQELHERKKYLETLHLTKTGEKTSKIEGQYNENAGW